MLFEGKVNSQTENLRAECKDWTNRSLHLRQVFIQFDLSVFMCRLSLSKANFPQTCMQLAFLFISLSSEHHMMPVVVTKLNSSVWNSIQSAYVSLVVLNLVFCRILGKQLILPNDEGFQHYQRRNANSVCSRSLPSLSEMTSSMKEYVDPSVYFL